MSLADEGRRALLEDYRLLVAPALKVCGFKAERLALSDELGLLETTHHLAYTESLREAKGTLQRLVFSYESLLNRDVNAGDFKGNSYQIIFAGSVTQTQQKGILNVFVQDSDSRKFGDFGKHLLQVVAPLTYYSGHSLFALLVKAFSMIEEVEQGGDADTVWLVYLLKSSDEPEEQVVCNLPVVYPTRKNTREELVRNALHLFENGYAV